MALSADKTRNLIQQMDLTEQLEIAGINSPQNVTLSGELQALLQMRDYAAEHKIFFRLLDLDYAFHSRKMESVRDFLACALEGLLPSRETSALFVSTVTGRPLPGDALTGEYWWNNVREAVDFSSAVQELASRNFRIFVEIGPHAILQRYIREGLGAANTKGRILPSLLRGDDGIAHLRKLAAQLHLLTDKTNMQRLFPCAGNAVPLPSYAWQKTRFWFPRTSECLPETRRAHPLLGWPLPGTEMLWENILDPAKDLWLADHKVGDTIVYPGAGYAEMALAAARAWLDGESLSLESLDITIPLVFEGHQAQCVRCGLNPTDGTFRIVSRPRLGSGEWVQHAEGRIIAVAGLATTSRMDPLPAGTAINGETLYKLTASLGLDYGPLFRVVRHIRM
ncbi:MAG: acyltransferase domain-containing protein, partial [Bilophila wadsworthia]